MDTENSLSRPTIVLHWLVAACVILLTAVGIYMVKTEAWHLYDIHKSIGLIASIIILVRIAWRLRNGLPKPVRAFTKIEHAAAKAAHWLLLAGTLAIPLTGMLFSGASGHGFGIFGLGIFPGNHGADGQVVPLDAGLSDLGQTLHGVFGYALLFVILAHVAGALKHHIVDRDATLRRMLGADVRGEERVP